MGPIKFVPDFSNLFGWARFCKIRQGEVAWILQARVTSVKSHNEH